MNPDAVYDLFKRHEKLYLCNSPWAKTRKGDIAAAIVNGSLRFAGDSEAPTAVALLRNSKRPTIVRDFTRAERAHIPVSIPIVEKIAYTSLDDALALLCTIKEGHDAVAFWTWTESLTDKLLREGKHEIASKIGAFSEMTTLAGIGDMGAIQHTLLPPYERSSLGLMRDWPEQDVGPLLAGLTSAAPAFTDHYSTYNRKHAWSAIAFKGYGGLVGDIHKPAEMSATWKKEHPEQMGRTLAWTTLCAQVPEVYPLLDFFEKAGVHLDDFHRVRIMRLAPGGGELERHADITDPDAGTEQGKIVRLHLPLVTNPKVEFQSWHLDGIPRTVHFPAGRWFYLDTRKPHRAYNFGEHDRLHLVVDVPSNEAIRKAMPQ